MEHRSINTIPRHEQNITTEWIVCCPLAFLSLLIKTNQKKKEKHFMLAHSHHFTWLLNGAGISLSIVFVRFFISSGLAAVFSINFYVLLARKIDFQVVSSSSSGRDQSAAQKFQLKRQPYVHFCCCCCSFSSFDSISIIHKLLLFFSNFIVALMSRSETSLLHNNIQYNMVRFIISPKNDRNISIILSFSLPCNLLCNKLLFAVLIEWNSRPTKEKNVHLQGRKHNATYKKLKNEKIVVVFRCCFKKQVKNKTKHTDIDPIFPFLFHVFSFSFSSSFTHILSQFP